MGIYSTNRNPIGQHVLGNFDTEMPEDIWGRRFETLRISLNEWCNLACAYCVDEKGFQKKAQHGIEVHQWLERLSVLGDSLELKKIRLTGGEPSMYPELIDLVQGIRFMMPDVQISMTTNAWHFPFDISDLESVGLNQLTVSLDALTESVFLKMTRKPGIDKVLRNISEAKACGLTLKVNTVMMREHNENELLPLLKWVAAEGFHIRFLELMQMGPMRQSFERYYFSESQLIETLAAEFTIEKKKRAKGSTAQIWHVKELDYEFGTISNTSAPFCMDCNRLRMDSKGNLLGCLSAGKRLNFPLHGNKSEVNRVLLQALQQKQLRFLGNDITMKEIGG